MNDAGRAPSIWWWAFGYFACYAPYSSLTKVLSSGLEPSTGGKVGGLELLPSSVMATVAVLIIFLAATGWWRFAGERRVLGRTIRGPGWPTFLSGVLSAQVIGTTTLAYTFNGVSIVFVMLLMRGGLLALAPVIDRISGRRVRWYSYAALGLALGSLAVSTTGGSAKITFLCALDVTVYLASYFVRLSLMSKLAKSTDPDANRRYFVEELMVSAPFLLLELGVAALVFDGKVGHDLRAGFTTFFDRPTAAIAVAFALGALSQGTGIFGNLIYLDKRENTFCVPVNRASSVLAGVLASSYLAATYATVPALPAEEWYGAALIIAAIGFLSIPPALAKRRAAQAAAAPTPSRSAAPRPRRATA